MILTPLVSPSPAAIRDALVRRGVSVVQAEATAGGLLPCAVMLEAVTPAEREQVTRLAAGHGVSCVTGEGWALLAGGLAQLASVSRVAPDGLPPEIASDLGRLLQSGVEPPCVWETRRGAVSLERPVVVGIVNLTPDSFSDGGDYLAPDRALAHADALLEAGAAVLDLGAESTRPDTTPVPEDEEWSRLEPVLTGVVLRFPEVPVSVDTVKAVTARRALDAGAWAINDVSGLRLDPSIADACAAHGAGLVLMHSRGGVSTMASYQHATYQDVTAEVSRELQAAVAMAEQRGVPRCRIVLDPGLGFSKTPEQSYEVLGSIPALARLGLPLMIGPSRKRFLGAATGRDVAERDVATAAACAIGWLLGAQLFRVHAVAPTRDALAVAHAARRS